MKKVTLFAICFVSLMIINPIHSEAKVKIKHLSMNEIGTAIRLNGNATVGQCALNRKETKKELKKLCKQANLNNRASRKCVRKAYKTVINVYDDC